MPKVKNQKYKKLFYTVCEAPINAPRKHLIFVTGSLIYLIRIIRLRQEDISQLDQAFTMMEHKHLLM